MEIARNLQQQVEYLTEELNKLKQSLGSALPDPIAGPTGPTGPTGATGEKGETGNGIIGYGTTLPLGGRNGDFFFLKTANDVVLYKKNNFGSWLAQTSIRGPRGPIAEPEQQIVANPEGTPTDYISTIDIDGVIYRLFLSAEEIQLVNALNETISIDEINNVEFVHDVEIDGNLEVNSNFTIHGIIELDDNAYIKIGDYNRYTITTTRISPYIDNYYSLGDEYHKWKDVYVTKIYGNTKEAYVDDVIGKTYNHRIQISNGNNTIYLSFINKRSESYTSYSQIRFITHYKSCLIDAFKIGVVYSTSDNAMSVTSIDVSESTGSIETINGPFTITDTVSPLS